jgi:DNA-binding MarR family transcriptional regulator
MSVEKDKAASSAAALASQWKLENGIGFLLRLLEAKYDGLYQSVTRQTDITPRQFGVLMALLQQGPMTASDLAERISCDRNTLSEMLKRMTARRLISKKSHPGDRRSIEVQITAKGADALLAVVPAAARLQDLMLAPLSQDDRAHFLRCMLVIAKSSPPDVDA